MIDYAPDSNDVSDPDVDNVVHEASWWVMPLYFFQLFFTNTVFIYLIKNTNNYARKSSDN